MLTDTHCHLDFNQFDQDRDQVISRAKAVGINRLLNPGINLESSRTATLLADKYPEVFAAVGVHPNDGDSWKYDSVSALRTLADHPKVVAIGEIGLDYYRDRTPRKSQVEIFKAQLNLAADLNLPVVIHCREAMEDILAILTDWQNHLKRTGSPLTNRPGVLHSFSGNQSEVDRVLKLNFLIGITGPVTFEKATDLQVLVKKLPEKAILVETDSPFLTPHPYRGKRNEPARVKLVADKISDLRKEVYNTLANSTTENARRLFGW